MDDDENNGKSGFGDREEERRNGKREGVQDQKIGGCRMGGSKNNRNKTSYNNIIVKLWI